MSLGSRRRDSLFLRRTISFRPINPISAFQKLLEWLRNDADKSLSGSEYIIDNASEVYRVQKGDSYITAKQDCTIILGEGSDRQVIFIATPSTGEANVTVQPDTEYFLEGKGGNLDVAVPNVYMLRYIAEEKNWKIMTKY